MIKKLIFCWGLLLCTFLTFAQDFPEKSNTIVTDYTNTLSADQKQQLENKLVAFNDSSSTQIAVVIIKSVGDYDINEYGTMLGRKWGIGQKDKNNGVLLLVAMNDHKMTIQTGYGVEGALPDAITQDIIQKDIKPRFKAGDYYGGIDAGTDDIIKYTKGEYKADAKQNKGNKKSGTGGGIGVLVIVFIILFIILRKRGGGGGGGHIIGGRGGASPFWWFLAGNVLGSSSRGNWGGFSGGGGGWGGGGGFGGFGGGSFGGGGSSGSW